MLPNGYYERPALWAIWLSGLTAAWSVLFWYIFLVKIAYGVYGVPLGLGGALYPIFFLPPVVVGTSLYSGALRWRFLDRPPSGVRLSLLSLGIPVVLATIALLVFCPTDSSGESFLELLWARL